MVEGQTARAAGTHPKALLAISGSPRFVSLGGDRTAIPGIPAERILAPDWLGRGRARVTPPA